MLCESSWSCHTLTAAPSTIPLSSTATIVFLCTPTGDSLVREVYTSASYIRQRISECFFSKNQHLRVWSNKTCDKRSTLGHQKFWCIMLERLRLFSDIFLVMDEVLFEQTCLVRQEGLRAYGMLLSNPSGNTMMATRRCCVRQDACFIFGMYITTGCDILE